MPADLPRVHTRTRFFWLLEKGQPPLYLMRRDRGTQDETYDPWAAERWRTKAHAEEFLRDHAHDKTFKAVEHGFVGEFPND